VLASRAATRTAIVNCKSPPRVRTAPTTPAPAATPWRLRTEEESRSYVEVVAHDSIGDLSQSLLISAGEPAEQFASRAT